MSIASEITRITNAKSAIGTAIAAKGVTVPSGTKLDGFSALIAAISGAPSGLNEVAYGTFTPISETSSATITHGMSGNPEGYFIWQNTVSRSGYADQIFFPVVQLSQLGSGYMAAVSGQSYYPGDLNVYGTGTVTVNVPSRAKFNHQTYYWIMWR